MTTSRRSRIEQMLTRLYVATGGHGPRWAKVKRAVERFVRETKARRA